MLPRIAILVVSVLAAFAPATALANQPLTAVAGVYNFAAAPGTPYDLKATFRR